MRLTIHIDTDNDAFAGGGAGPEVARILRDLADRFAPWVATTEAAATGPLRDINGNTVGAALLYDADDIRERLAGAPFAYFDDRPAPSVAAVQAAVAEIHDGRGRPFCWARNCDDAAAIVQALNAAAGSL